METWPEKLPGVQLQFGDDAELSNLRSAIEGHAEQRPRFDVEVRRQAVRWMFSDFKYALFQSFVCWKLHQGADKFIIDLPFGNGVENVVACFQEGVWRASYQAPNWIVTAILEIDTPPTELP